MVKPFGPEKPERKFSTKTKVCNAEKCENVAENGSIGLILKIAVFRTSFGSAGLKAHGNIAREFLS